MVRVEETCNQACGCVCVCRLLASKNLPAAIEDTGGNELPESIREKANLVKTQGGVGTIETKLYGLPESLQRNKEILNEVSVWHWSGIWWMSWLLCAD